MVHLNEFFIKFDALAPCIFFFCSEILVLFRYTEIYISEVSNSGPCFVKLISNFTISLS